MDLEKFVEKARYVRNALIGAGLTGLTLFGAGCETMNTADWIAFAAGAAAGDEKKTEEQRKAAAHIEQIAKEQAQRQHERDLAEKSRNETKQEVNVYVENEREKEQDQGQREVPQTGRYFFACNYYKDFNNNCFANYPDEYVGIKHKFRDDEKIILVSHDEKNRKGQLWEMEIYNPSGELIVKNKMILPYNGTEVRRGENFDMTNWLIQNGGYGNFKTVWYLDGKYAGSTEFEIVK